MAVNSAKRPSVLLLVTASLGIFFGLLCASFVLWTSLKFLDSDSKIEAVGLMRNMAAFSICISLLNLPAFILSIIRLKGIQIRKITIDLFKLASCFVIVWIIILILYARLAEFKNVGGLMAALTFIMIAIPIWWLVEFARKGIQRPTTLIEWGSLSLGLTVIPFIIIILEGLSIVCIAVLLLLLFYRFQPEILVDIAEVFHLINNVSNSTEVLELLSLRLFQNPKISFFLFLVIGGAAPFLEELIKPLSVWFLLEKPIKPGDGFVIGLISGGAFTLLESTGLVSQLNFRDWHNAVLLRSATAWLHISMSGFVGYGIAKARVVKSWGIALRNLMVAVVLHCLWNSTALLSEYQFITHPNLKIINNWHINFSAAAWLLPVILIAATIIVIRLRSQLAQGQKPEGHSTHLGATKS